ncbi:unnamed protein product [Lota lota]
MSAEPLGAGAVFTRCLLPARALGPGGMGSDRVPWDGVPELQRDEASHLIHAASAGTQYTNRRARLQTREP